MKIRKDQDFFLKMCLISQQKLLISFWKKTGVFESLVYLKEYFLSFFLVNLSNILEKILFLSLEKCKKR